jgi:hypothetical protein
VGLDLRPRKLREAAAVWSALTSERGVAGRDALWAHPDLAPTAEAFEDPLGFARANHADDDSDMDAALAELLDNGDGNTDGDGSTNGTEGDGPGDAPRAEGER